MFGSGGIGNRTSLLYQQLVENQIAASVNGSLTATIDPATYSLYITCRPDHEPEEVLTVIDETVDRLLQEKVNLSSFNRALKQAKASFAYSSDNITNQAFWMGYSESFADYSWFCEYVERLAQVSADDLLRVAQKYLKPENRVVGIYRGGKMPELSYNPASLPGKENILRQSFENGSTLLAYPNLTSPAVFFRGYLPAGSISDPPLGKEGLANFNAAMLSTGTRKHDFQELHYKIESCGASISISSGSLSTLFGGQCLKEDLPEVFNLLLEMLSMPAYPQKHFERIKQQFLTVIRIQAQTRMKCPPRHLIAFIIATIPTPFHLSVLRRAWNASPLTIFLASTNNILDRKAWSWQFQVE